ncbi:leucyl aminopeptidase family protein [Ancylobacter mangrovi]|uniref:leucyl aminopeptidase family protein n=1 Tax=Ancylobacter mangrovi TaxID=2972472 RepID=UPI002162320E|nr:leucyl aminopeptidase [Ancylobacter mangrovi]MCS0505116.1 leucyl aminopeptidase [Ancylobacter mangrovi]
MSALTVVTTPAAQIACDALILPLAADHKPLDPALARVVAAEDVAGRPDEAVVIASLGLLPAARLVLTGLGAGPVTPEEARRAAGAAVKALRGRGVSRIVIDTAGLPEHDADGFARVVQALVEGALSADYEFARYRTQEPGRARIAHLAIAVPAGRQVQAEPALRRAGAVADAVNAARDLCNEPPNRLTPAAFAARIEALGADPRLNVSVLGRAAMEELGMGALLAVAQGSRHEPRFVRADYRPAAAPNLDAPLVLVGKSVTFDTGGISLKPALDMERQKTDMGGGAAVFGALTAALALGLPLAVTGLFPIVENMPGGGATRPGDVVRTLSGRTVEILNTDAEGRLILADALHYARSLNPRAIIDLATLTGASSIVFGPVGIGLFASDLALAVAFQQAEATAGERVWPLPLWPEYRELLRSRIADLRNISTTIQQGSMMTAASFLRAFVGDEPWAHLDIYNTAWNEAEHPHLPKGPTASGTRLLAQFLIDEAQRAGAPA